MVALKEGFKLIVVTEHRGQLVGSDERSTDTRSHPEMQVKLGAYFKQPPCGLTIRAAVPNTHKGTTRNQSSKTTIK